jgi:hypothetical protein
MKETNLIYCSFQVLSLSSSTALVNVNVNVNANPRCKLARQSPLCKSDWYDKVRTQYGVSVCLPEVADRRCPSSRLTPSLRDLTACRTSLPPLQKVLGVYPPHTVSIVDRGWVHPTGDRRTRRCRNNECHSTTQNLLALRLHRSMFWSIMNHQDDGFRRLVPFFCGCID